MSPPTCHVLAGWAVGVNPPANAAAPVIPAKTPYAVARQPTGTRSATVGRSVDFWTDGGAPHQRTRHGDPTLAVTSFIGPGMLASSGPSW
ncbi:hypothetical protein [Streptomyces neyagawaensis]|uniref:Uncharacterized protein n=1 Tax=Streptomyces neyagawaensis TaxID=42238 RepID=A0ABV3AUM6_9ACTN